ncbi:Lumazine-binding protein [Violaceomyces palustris]|uniref:Lumazine-binding protein n=1 Tax=Violaceomyces palustris TaxID=1673888 RepID=A0ACD0NW59_9BASI|nr:Lumazine-binding protein [Violaceomyces palustris]
MFTGIVELLAPIISIDPLDSSASGGGGFSITIGDCHQILTDCHIGDSIAVNGTCLTVTEFDASPSKDGGYFKIGVAPETLKKTNLGELKKGDKVNCERAMAAHTRFGGHFVQGHVDTTAILQSMVPTGNALTLTLRLSHSPGTLPLPSSLSPYLIPKGYVTLDGASLTLIDVSPPQGGPLTPSTSSSELEKKEIVEFTVMLIAHTQEVIGLPAKRPGDKVNVELDMVGKFVHRAVMGSVDQASNPSSSVEDGNTTASALERVVERVVRKVLSERS